MTEVSAKPRGLEGTGKTTDGRRLNFEKVLIDNEDERRLRRNQRQLGTDSKAPGKQPLEGD